MNITIEGTGIDYLYPDGVPIVEITVDIDTVFKKVARKTSIAVLADPYFEGRTQQQKFLSELHGNGSRIAKDFIEDAATDILPIFTPMQRWMQGRTDVKTFELNSAENPGKIIYRYQFMDNRPEDQKLNYTSETDRYTKKDIGNIVHGKKYLEDAIESKVMFELYQAIMYLNKMALYEKAYINNRRHAAFWFKNEGLLTQYNVS